MTDIQKTPLLDFTDLPRYDLIQPEHVQPAISQLLTDNRALIERLTSDAVPATWQDFAQPLTDGLEQFNRAWGVVGHLHSVNDISVWRDAYNAMLPEVSGFFTDLGQNLALFDKYKALRNGAEFAKLNPVQQRILENELRDFRLSGAELPDDQKPRFKEIMEDLSKLSAKFSENLLDATNAFAEIVTDEAVLAGLPDDVKQVAKETAERGGLKNSWKFSLQAPSFGPVMQYAENRELRARMYRAYSTRAAEFHAENGDGSSKAEWDNTPIMKRILELKREDAQMLGFSNYAEVSLVPKMADTPAQVQTFLRELATKARPYAEKDRDELRAFARDELGLDPLLPWDVAYASEKLLLARYAFSEQEVKQYFTEPKVVGGLFKVIESLFGVKVKADTAPVWHEDARFYRIEKPSGELVGQFYMDLYARQEKRGGAWMDEARSRRTVADGIQTPIAYLNCNFARPVGNKPATFTHDEVQTLFHEAGHGLHHLLTRIDELSVSGIHGVEWDAVELPSQFMENFCWEWSVLQDMTAHVDTGEALPRALFDKMIAAKNFQSGLMALRQIEFSIFDMLLHSDFDPNNAEGKTVMDVLQAVRQEIAVLIPPEWNRFPNSFSHIFGGGYAAGYYSYKWAEVLSADAYAAFEEAGSPFDAATGKRYLDEILSVGGSRPAIESFRAFRGRDPSVDALLRHNGMA
ncbi:MAG: hypothetical protein RIR18_1861 [Pseudomonadota bacterium]|jgi:oligopeptidase A